MQNRRNHKSMNALKWPHPPPTKQWRLSLRHPKYRGKSLFGILLCFYRFSAPAVFPHWPTRAGHLSPTGLKGDDTRLKIQPSIPHPRERSIKTIVLQRLPLMRDSLFFVLDLANKHIQVSVHFRQKFSQSFCISVRRQQKQIFINFYYVGIM